MEIKISLMQFMTFKSKISTEAKYNYVKSQKYREKYSPAQDYWKYFREAIQNLGNVNGNFEDLNKIIGKIDASRINNYKLAIDKFIKLRVVLVKSF